MVYDSAITWTDGSAGTAYCVLKTAGASTRVIFKTADGGATWASLSANVALFSTCCPHGYVRSGYYQWGYDSTNDFAYRYDTTHHKFLKVYNSTDIDNPIMVTDNCVIMDSSGSGSCTIDVYAPRLADVENIANAMLSHSIVTGHTVGNQLDLQVASAYASYWEIADLVELYDAWDTLWFRGVVVSKRIANGLCSYVALDSTRELAKNFTMSPADDDMKMNELLDAMVDTMTDGTVGTIQDVNYNGGDVHYHIQEHPTMQPGVRLFRAMERSVIWVTPAGAWNRVLHDDCDATGYRWKYKTGLPVTLIDNEAEVKDAKVTRAAVMRAGNARDSYTGDSSQENLNGIVQASDYKDTSIQDSGDAVNLAEQLYAIFSTATTFVRLLVANHGFLQPGKTVDFSWSLGDTTVARATLIVIAVHAYMLNDIQEVVLSNNIVLESEYDNLELIDDE
jgi:hypothetical protein